MGPNDTPLPIDRGRALAPVPADSHGGASAPAALDGRRQPHPRGPVGVRIAQLPATRQEIYALERACLKAAKQGGHRGKYARIEAARIYNAAIDECGNKVREPATQQQIVQAPESPLATREAPKGMTQLDSGLYVPEVK